MPSLSPGAAAILQARQRYATRPPHQTDPYEPDPGKPKPPNDNTVLAGSGALTKPDWQNVGNGGAQTPPPSGGHPGADLLARQQRLNAYRTQHAQFNAGRRVYGHNNSGEIPVYDNATWLPGQRPDQVPGTGSYAQANAPRTPAGTAGAPVPMGAGTLGAPNGPGTAAGPAPTTSPYGPPKPTYGDGGGPNKSGSDRNNFLKSRLGMI